MLEVEALEQYYGESHTLWEISFRVPEGGCVCLLGRNGVGKTTLLKCLMGLLPPASGAIRFQGRDIARLPPERRACLGIGYVPQGREIFPFLSVEENLRLALLARPDGTCRIPERVFELFPALGQVLHRRGGDLSGGQQQQLAIARALALDPKLLILDEPTEGIQPNLVHEIGTVIAKLSREDGLTVLLVEQKLHFVRQVADYFYLMNKGRICAQGTMNDLSPELVRQYLTV